MTTTLPREHTEETHGVFLSSLDRSIEGVWTVARWMYSREFSIRIPAITRAPTHEEWRDHSDSGDFYATKLGEDVERCFEVKWLDKTSFTGRRDWPFKDFIVDGKPSFDRKDPKPHAYIALSADKRGIGIVMADTAAAWWPESRFNKKMQIWQDFYICNLDIVRFATIGGEA